MNCNPKYISISYYTNIFIISQIFYIYMYNFKIICEQFRKVIYFVCMYNNIYTSRKLKHYSY